MESPFCPVSPAGKIRAAPDKPVWHAQILPGRTWTGSLPSPSIITMSRE